MNARKVEFTDAEGREQWIEHRKWLTYGDREDFERFFHERTKDEPGRTLDRVEQLEFTITGWSFVEPVTAENIRRLLPFDIVELINAEPESPNGSAPSSNGTPPTKAKSRARRRSRGG